MENCFANWQLILEYVKVVLSWPAVTLLVLAYVLRSFREEISALIRRTKEADVFGQRVQFAQDQDVSTIPKPPPAAGLAAELTGSGVPATGAVASSSAPSAGSTVTADHSGETGAQTPEEIARHPVQAAQVIRYWWATAKHESLLNRIYGTQFRVLTILEAKDAAGETLANLSPFYTEHERLSAGAMVPASPVPDYIAFLTSMTGLARMEGAGDSAKFFITPAGKGFLEYVRHSYRVIPPRAF